MQDIPADILKDILGYSEQESLCQAAAVSKTWMLLALQSVRGDTVRWTGGGKTIRTVIHSIEEPKHLFVGRDSNDVGVVSMFESESDDDIYIAVRNISYSSINKTIFNLPKKVVWFSVAGKKLLTLCDSEIAFQFVSFSLYDCFYENTLLTIPNNVNLTSTNIFSAYHIHTDLYIIYVDNTVYTVGSDVSTSTLLPHNCSPMWNQLSSCIYVCSKKGFIIMCDVEERTNVYYLPVDDPTGVVILPFVGYGVSPCGGIVVGISNKRKPYEIMKGSDCRVDMPVVASSRRFLRGVVLSSSTVTVATSNNLGLPPDELHLYNLSDFVLLQVISLTELCPSFVPKSFSSSIVDPCFAIKMHTVRNCPAISALLPHSDGSHSLLSFIADVCDNCVGD